VLAPPGVVMVASPKVPCNAERAQKHRPRERGKQNRATNSSIKAEAPHRSANIAGEGMPISSGIMRLQRESGRERA
jgi:hypothetical protein